MEHRLILGAAQYLPFARSRIRALRAIGKSYAVERYLMPDGTIAIRIEGEHEYIHLSGGLAHGLAVASNWAPTRFYKFNGTDWSVDGRPVPQVDNSGEHPVTGYNQVVRTGAVLPLVYLEGTQKLWDTAPHRGPEPGGQTWRVPFNLQYTDGEVTFNRKRSHMLHDYTVQDLEGVEIYAMPESPALQVPPEQIIPLPGNSDCKGVNAALQLRRSALVSGSSWQHSFCNEVIRRAAQDTYEVVERNTVGFSTPFDATNTVVEDETFTTLDLPNADEVFGVDFYPGGTGTVVDPSNPMVNLPYIYLAEYRPTDWTSLATILETAYRYQYEQGAAAITALDKLVAMPTVEGVDYARLELAMSYPAVEYWRGGTKSWSYNVSSHYPSGAYMYGRSYSLKERRDAEHSVSAAPAATLDLGWVNVDVFEGTVAGDLSGRYHKNTFTDIKINSTTFHFYVYAITERNVLITDPGGGDSWLWVTSKSNLIPGWHAEYDAQPETGTTESVADDTAMTCTGSYSYTTRHIIDYDHKAQFYAAIRVDVVCSGASWRQFAAGWRGQLEVNTDPTYTVRIYFESCWKGAVSSQLLVEESGVRPAFEFTEHSHLNVFRYPDTTPGYEIDYWMPPEPSLPEDVVEQIARLAHHQGVNTNLAAADVRPDIAEGSEQIAASGIDITGNKFVRGQLYARTFRIADFPEALWLLSTLNMDAPENNTYPENGSEVMWFYLPNLGATITDTEFHIEVRNGEIVDWSQDIPPSDDEALPSATERDIRLYRV